MSIYLPIDLGLEREDNRGMKRKPGVLFPIEVSILQAGLGLLRSDAAEFYGYAIAREIREQGDTRQLTAHGTLYRALERLEKAGLLASRWEDPEVAAGEERPRRRLYRITAEGATAAEAAGVAVATNAQNTRVERGLAPS